MQSEYRRYHSTETVVLNIVRHTLCSRSRRDFLCLLDLSAAFDTVDRDILDDRLERAFTIWSTWTGP